MDGVDHLIERVPDPLLIGLQILTPSRVGIPLISLVEVLKLILSLHRLLIANLVRGDIVGLPAMLFLCVARVGV